MQKIQRNLILAILFLLPVYLIKIKFGWASFNLLELLIGALFLIWILNKEKKYLILSTKYFIPALLIVAGLLLSILVNKNYYSGFGAIKGWFVVPLIFAVIFFDALAKDEGLLKKSLLALFWSGAAVSAIGIVYKLLGIATYDNRLSIFWDSPNQLAMFLAAPFLIGISCILPSLLSKSSSPAKGEIERGFAKEWERFAIFFGLAAIIIDLYFTKSSGAWLGIAVALAVMFWLGYKEKISKKYLALVLTILVIFFGWAGFAKYESAKALGGRSSLASREMIWESAALMAQNNPFFGVGPGNFQNKYLEYQKYFPPYLEWSAPQPHNVYLAFWLESGIFGLVGFLWIMILFFRDNKIAIRNNRDLGTLFLAIMAYILVHGLVDTTYWRNDLAVVFWAVVAGNIYLAERKQSNSET